MRNFRRNTELAYWVTQAPKRYVVCTSRTRQVTLKRLFPAMADHFILPGNIRGKEASSAIFEEISHENEVIARVQTV